MAKQIYSQTDFNSYFYVTIGNQTFDQRLGQILGTPYVSFVTGQHDFAQIVLDDPKGDIYPTIEEDDEVLIEVGFSKTERFEVMSGTISKLGRRYPDGTIVEVKDFSSQSKNSNTQVVSSKGVGEETSAHASLETPGVLSSRTSHVPGVSPGTVSSRASVLLYSELNARGEAREDVSAQVASSKNLTYKNNSKIITDKPGEVILGEDLESAAVREAEKVGDRIVTEGKELIRVAPGEGKETNIVLDYKIHRSAFVGVPTITKRTDNQKEGAFGSWRVEGWNVDRKTKVSATIIVPSKLEYDPDKKIDLLGLPVPLGQPIYENSLYTWGDCTLGGVRIPQNSQIVERIISVAKILDALTIEYTDNQKWQIISWYNDRPLNVNGKHNLGYAVDVYTPNLDKIYKELEPKWQGGMALYSQRFLHLDLRQQDGLPSARWEF